MACVERMGTGGSLIASTLDDALMRVERLMAVGEKLAWIARMLEANLRVIVNLAREAELIEGKRFLMNGDLHVAFTAQQVTRLADRLDQIQRTAESMLGGKADGDGQVDPPGDQATTDRAGTGAVGPPAAGTRATGVRPDAGDGDPAGGPGPGPR